MKVSEMQSNLQKLENEFKKWLDQFPQSQRNEFQKSFIILRSGVSKIQKWTDQENAERKYESEPSYDTDMDFWGETDTMY